MMNLFVFFISLLVSPTLFVSLGYGQRQRDASEKDRQVLHWYAPFYSGGGYCSEALSFVSILSNLSNLTVQISQHGDSVNQNFIENMRYDDKLLLDMKFTRRASPGEISICHSEPGAWDAPTPHYYTHPCPPSNSRYKIGRTMFETDRLPSGWAKRLNFMDEIWVPTRFAYQIFLQEGVEERKLQIVSEPLDTDFFSPQFTDNAVNIQQKLKTTISELLIKQMTSPLTDSTFLYLFVGKWEYRKGVNILLKAFFNEFNQSYSSPDSVNEREDIALIIVTRAYHSTNDFFNAIIHDLLKFNIIPSSILRSPSSSPSPSQTFTLADLESSHPITQLLRRVVLLTDVPQDDMPSLYQISNILVIPSRGEGWGRPHVEAMSCGLPIIATNWSGVTAYLTESNGYPLAIDGLVEVKGWKDHHWAEPSLSHLQHLLRHIFNHREEALLKGQQARRDMIESYSYTSFEKILIQHLNRIQNIISNSNQWSTNIVKEQINEEL